jgi:hypothetical protein
MPFSENRSVCGILLKNIVDPERPQMTSQYGVCAPHAGKARLHARTRMQMPTLVDTHMHAHRPISNIYYFPQQHLLRERTSMLRYTHFDCIVYCKV